MLPRAEPAPADHGTVTDAHSPRLSPGAAETGDRLAGGHVLAGRYRVVSYIAGGGMGEVYAVDDALLGERVALKLLRLELSRKPGAHERFGDEIRMARRVTHPNVCRVFDVGVDGERVFFTMAMHAGETLAARLRREAPLDEVTARPIVRQLMAGIIAAHAADIVHADLKPSNVLLGGEDGCHVVITDFGLAVPCCSEFGCDCRMPHLLGTPAYMAPEQIEGGMALMRTDIFSLGVILFEMMTGVLPFRGDSALEMARARLEREPPAPLSLRPDLDPRWDTAILACLARDPKARPEKVSDVAAALGIALA
jgi:serine/threonine protein kinase